jgi:hypothetical protein
MNFQMPYKSWESAFNDWNGLRINNKLNDLSIRRAHLRVHETLSYWAQELNI